MRVCFRRDTCGGRGGGEGTGGRNRGRCVWKGCERELRPGKKLMGSLCPHSCSHRTGMHCIESGAKGGGNTHHLEIKGEGVVGGEEVSPTGGDTRGSVTSQNPKPDHRRSLVLPPSLHSTTIIFLLRIELLSLLKRAFVHHDTAYSHSAAWRSAGRLQWGGCILCFHYYFVYYY